MNQPIGDGDSVEGIDILGFLGTYGRRAIAIAVGVASLVMVAGAVQLYWRQPVTRTSVLEFRPTFTGAGQGHYPNGLPFAPSDVAAATILDSVYDANTLDKYCDREALRAGFFVEQQSALSAVLDAEYVGLLIDSKITAVERQRLEAQYEAKRNALPLQYRLVFVKPLPCASMPQIIVAKVMTDVLTTWASESETKRGVLNLQVEVLTPGMLDVGVGLESSRLLRADLLRTALWRIIDNVGVVGGLPGAMLLRFGPEQLTFVEVRNKLVDLVRSRLEPMVVGAGQSMVRESLSWVTETVATAEREQKAAEGRAAAYLDALREYSGTAQSAPIARGAAIQTPTSSSDVQTLSPQIDRTFIDRIIEMSEGNTTFRQQLTRSMVTATVEAVAAQERAGYYRRLLQSLREPGDAQLSAADIDVRLAEIVDQGKALTTQFNDLYMEFSRVSLRAAASMYQTEKPVTTEVSREFTPRELVMLVVGAFFATLLLTFGYFVIRDLMQMGATEPAR